MSPRNIPANHQKPSPTRTCHPERSERRFFFRVRFLRTRRSRSEGSQRSSQPQPQRPLSTVPPKNNSKYALTRIYVLWHIWPMENAFEIVAEPNRRAILSLLTLNEHSVGEIERQLHMSQPAVSKHLRVLRDAGFVESTVDAQRRLYRLKSGPFQELDAWLAQFRRFWSVHIDALERHLDRMDQSLPAKGKTPRKNPNRNPKNHDKGETK